MEANDYQIGGDHYAKEYQHWDFVCDTGMHYLLGCFTKYITRWRKKNGLEDLKKSLHYLTKAEDKGITFPSCPVELVNRYIKDMKLEEATIIMNISTNKFEKARTNVLRLIAEIEGEVTSDYVDQD